MTCGCVSKTGVYRYTYKMAALFRKNDDEAVDGMMYPIIYSRQTQWLQNPNLDN